MESPAASPKGLHDIINMVETLQAVNPHMRVSRAAVLLTIASRPGIIITELGKAANLSRAAASRIARELSDVSSGKTDGLGLVSFDLSQDARLRPLRLNHKGRAVVQMAVEALRSPEPAP